MRKVCGNDTQNLWYAEQQSGCIAIQKWYAEHRCFFLYAEPLPGRSPSLIRARDYTGRSGSYSFLVMRCHKQTILTSFK